MHSMQQYLLHRLIQQRAKLLDYIFSNASPQQWHSIIIFKLPSKKPCSIFKISQEMSKSISTTKVFPSNYIMERQVEQEIFEDDLENYQDIIDQQVCNEIMNHRQVEDDAHRLQQSQSADEGQGEKKELTEQQRQARELKLRNTRKYFEIVRLTYIKEVNEALRETSFVKKNHEKIVCKLLSLLNRKEIQEFNRLKRMQPLSLKIEEVMKFLKNVHKHIKMDQFEEEINASILLWSVCESLKIACRKIFFFDLQALVQETFYKLNYHSLEKAVKKQARRAKEIQLMKIEIDLKRQEQQKKEKNDYLHFEDFQFNANSFKNSLSQSSSRPRKTEQQTQQIDDADVLKSRRQNNHIRKRNYKWAYFHIFSVDDEKWKLVNSQILEFEDQINSRNYLLSTKPIIGFYSCRILHFRPQFTKLTELRTFKDILVQDLTMYFFDNMKQLALRRRRVGLRYNMKQIFEIGSFHRHRFLLQNYDQYVMNKNDELQLQFQMTNFPKSKEDMLNSEFFVIPSLIPKYTILESTAQPIEKEFMQEKVYLRRNLVPVTSKMVWIDRGRKVKNGQMPVKKTENKSKNMTQLFLHQQTEPFYLSIDPQTGNFISDDQYNSVYIPPDYQFEEIYTVVTENIGSICNKHHFRHTRIAQGFTHNIGRILPNYVGFLIYKEDKQKIMQLYRERQEYLLKNKQKNREKFLIGLWNKLFTKIELNEWSNNLAR